MFEPKKNDVVNVCYDGKLGRKVEGKVISRKGFAVLVEFIEWASDSHKKVQNWFVRTSPDSFGGYLRVPDSFMKTLVGTPGDWYSVYDINDGR